MGGARASLVRDARGVASAPQHRRVKSSVGADADIRKAIEALPWVDQLCPLMRHQYAVLRKSPAWAWYAPTR